MLRVTSHLELPWWSMLSDRRWRGGHPQLQDFASSRMAFVERSRDLALGVSFVLHQKFNSCLKLFSIRLHDRILGWLISGRSRYLHAQRLGRSRRFCTKRPGNIQPNEFGIRPWTTFNRLPLHLLILRTESGMNT